jgi:Peptidase family M23/D-alanyl-D-alanine carboxypeptidase
MQTVLSTAISLVLASGMAVTAPSLISDPVDSTELFAHVEISDSLSIDLSDPSVSAAYENAKDYIDFSQQAWNDQYAEAYWEQESIIIQGKADAAQVKYEEAVDLAEEAQAEADEAKKIFMSWYRDSSRNSSPLGSTTEAILGGPENFDDFANSIHADEVVSSKIEQETQKAYDSKQKADEAQKTADEEKVKFEELEKNAAASLESAHTSKDSSSQSLSEARTKWSDAWKDLDPDESDSVVPLGSRIFNYAAIEKWNEQLDQLESLDISIPTTQELANTQSFPEGINEAPSVSILDTTGVGYVDGKVVPSQESILRTSKALSNVGAAYSAAGTGADGTWSCLPFIQSTTGQSDASFNDIFENSGRQNASLLDTHSGDVVFFSDPQAGIHQAGVYLFGGFVVNASAASGYISVDPIGVDAIASVRPGTVIAANQKAPIALPNAPAWQCGGIAHDMVQESTEWTLPIPEDNYTLGAKFNDTSSRFGSEPFNGLEFVTTENQTIAADFEGLITSVITEDPVLGNAVTIQHSDGLITQYSGLSAVSVPEGASVTGGQIVGIAGTSGSQSSLVPALFVSIMLDGEYIDPETMFFPPSTGQYTNGNIPPEALCPVGTSGLLRCDAARAFQVLNSAYKEEFGTDFAITDTYRSLEGQIQCQKDKGSLCATPGFSQHGWGLAVDLSGGVNTFGSPQHIWMKENAEKYGWYHPDWAQANGSKPEAWHWEFIATK